jgi:hypothetical protein
MDERISGRRHRYGYNGTRIGYRRCHTMKDRCHLPAPQP